VRVICVNAGEKFGFYPSYLTEGREYEVVRSNSETVTVIGDDGKHRGCWPDRFVPSDGSVVACGERAE
jgi:hypothetical protein